MKFYRGDFVEVRTGALPARAAEVVCRVGWIMYEVTFEDGERKDVRVDDLKLIKGGPTRYIETKRGKWNG